MEQRDEAFDPLGLLTLPTSLVWERGQATAVSSDLETLVLVHTVTGSRLYLDSVSVSGTFAAEFRLYLNGIHKETKRIEVSDPSPSIPFFGVPLQVGETIEVRVIHSHAGFTHHFESTLRAHR